MAGLAMPMGQTTPEPRHGKPTHPSTRAQDEENQRFSWVPYLRVSQETLMLSLLPTIWHGPKSKHAATNPENATASALTPPRNTLVPQGNRGFAPIPDSQKSAWVDIGLHLAPSRKFPLRFQRLAPLTFVDPIVYPVRMGKHSVYISVCSALATILDERFGDGWVGRTDVSNGLSPRKHTLCSKASCHSRESGN